MNIVLLSRLSVTLQGLIDNGKRQQVSCTVLKVAQVDGIVDLQEKAF